MDVHTCHGHLGLGFEPAWLGWEREGKPRHACVRRPFEGSWWGKQWKKPEERRLRGPQG